MAKGKRESNRNGTWKKVTLVDGSIRWEVRVLVDGARRKKRVKSKAEGKNGLESFWTKVI